MTRVYLGLGGNLGDPRRQMGKALQALNTAPGQRVVAVSPVYRTPPWGNTDQPDFLNACACLETPLGPGELLDLCLAVEHGLDRERNERWGPRTVDIDILDFGGQVMKRDALTLPHPRLRDRAFVLVPLRDIAPDLMLFGQPVAQWLSAIDQEGIRLEVADPDWWRL